MGPLRVLPPTLRRIVRALPEAAALLRLAGADLRKPGGVPRLAVVRWWWMALRQYAKDPSPETSAAIARGDVEEPEVTRPRSTPETMGEAVRPGS